MMVKEAARKRSPLQFGGGEVGLDTSSEGKPLSNDTKRRHPCVLSAFYLFSFFKVLNISLYFVHTAPKAQPSLYNAIAASFCVNATSLSSSSSRR